MPVSRELKMCICKETSYYRYTHLCSYTQLLYTAVHNLFINFTNKTCLPVSKLAKEKRTDYK